MIKRQTDPILDEAAAPEPEAMPHPIPGAGTVELPNGTAAVHARPIIRLVNLHKSFGRLHVLNGISEEFPKGKTTVVLGPSGTGKSVMLKCILGLLRPDNGEIWFEDQRVDTLSEARLAPIRRQF